MKYIESQKITNLFLYGQETKPENIKDSALIREPDNPDEPENRPNYNVDVNEFMTTGAGRFGLAPNFKFIWGFFHPIDVRSNPASYELQPGRYTKKKIFERFNIDGDGENGTPNQFKDRAFKMAHLNYGDLIDDYAERVYIYNTMAFQVNDDAIFVVEGTGNESVRYIENFATLPVTTQQETFDFESDKRIATLGNELVLINGIDPSRIGRPVNINFTGEILTHEFYDITDFNREQDVIDKWTDPSLLPGPLNELSAFDEMREVSNAIYQTGDTQFLEEGTNRQILYGTVNDDSYLDTEHLKLADDVGFETIYPNRINGSIQFTGAGDDNLRGGDQNDELFGGFGNDDFLATNGSDVLHGGDNTTEFATDGNDAVDYSFVDASLKVDLTSSLPEFKIVFVEKDDATQDTLVSIEKITLGAKSDEVIVDKDFVTSISSFAIDGGTSLLRGADQNGAKDTLNLEAFSDGVKVDNTGALLNRKTLVSLNKDLSLTNFEIFKYGNGDDIHAYTGTQAQEVHLGEGNDYYIKGDYATRIYSGTGKDEVLIGNNIQFEDLDSTDKVALYIDGNGAGNYLTGGTKSTALDTPWVLDGNGARYSPNKGVFGKLCQH